MKFNVSSTELLKGLMDISKAIPAKSALPILENFLFDLKGNILEVTASDSELTLRTEIEVDTTQEEGKIAVPARHMIDLLKELPDQPVAISTASDSSIECKWTSGNSCFLSSLPRTTLRSRERATTPRKSSSRPRASSKASTARSTPRQTMRSGLR